MSYYNNLGADNADPLVVDDMTQQNAPADKPSEPLPVIPSPDDVKPELVPPSFAPPSPTMLTPLTPMGPTKTFMEKLDEPGLLGVTWKTWVIGAGAVAALRYFSTRSNSVTANRRRRRAR